APHQPEATNSRLLIALLTPIRFLFSLARPLDLNSDFDFALLSKDVSLPLLAGRRLPWHLGLCLPPVLASDLNGQLFQPEVKLCFRSPCAPSAYFMCKKLSP